MLGPEDGCASVGKEVTSPVTGENEFYKGKVTSVDGRQEMGCVCAGGVRKVIGAERRPKVQRKPGVGRQKGGNLGDES